MLLIKNDGNGTELSIIYMTVQEAQRVSSQSTFSMAKHSQEFIGDYVWGTETK
jgi:hypothetical protein